MQIFLSLELFYSIQPIAKSHSTLFYSFKFILSGSFFHVFIDYILFIFSMEIISIMFCGIVSRKTMSDWQMLEENIESNLLHLQVALVVRNWKLLKRIEIMNTLPFAKFGLSDYQLFTVKHLVRYESRMKFKNYLEHRWFSIILLVASQPTHHICFLFFFMRQR